MTANRVGALVVVVALLSAVGFATYGVTANRLSRRVDAAEAKAHRALVVADLALRLSTRTAARRDAIIATLARKAGDRLTPPQQLAIAALLDEASQRDPGIASVVMAVIERESGFDPSAVSSAGAVGLMQLMPSTARMHGRSMGIDLSREDLFDPALNVRLGVAELRRLRGEFDTWMLALHAYFWGPGNTRDLLTSRARVAVPSLEYPAGVTDLRRSYYDLDY